MAFPNAHIVEAPSEAATFTSDAADGAPIEQPQKILASAPFINPGGAGSTEHAIALGVFYLGCES